MFFRGAQMVKKLVTSKQSNEILFLIQKLAGDFARSPHPNQRKGALLGEPPTLPALPPPTRFSAFLSLALSKPPACLLHGRLIARLPSGIPGRQTHDGRCTLPVLSQPLKEACRNIFPSAPAGLAAVACGLTNQHIKEYLPEMIPPVLESVTDQDTRVRFYAVEALYNIADIARESMLPFMLQAFDGLFRVSGGATSLGAFGPCARLLRAGAWRVRGPVFITRVEGEEGGWKVREEERDRTGSRCASESPGGNMPFAPGDGEGRGFRGTQARDFHATASSKPVQGQEHAAATVSPWVPG